MCGCSTKRPTALGTLTLTSPSGSAAPRPPIAITASAAASRVRQCANASSPLSLSRSLRVVRCSSCSVSACSSFATLRLTAEGEAPSLRAAAEKLPLSTTWTKTAISANSA